jgi:thioredoxin 1
MMTNVRPYSPDAPAGDDVAATAGPVLLDFGTDWCGHCRAAGPAVAEALATHPGVRHLKVEDGRGRPLGRAYGVKLWPTLVFLRDGREVARLVRPRSAVEVADALSRIDPAA